ncbi:MAG TPA: hypothetical protein PKE00_06600 [Planctomycetota bacterium]|nr:hypothetical protein [Planctomycetota bacterium]
MNKTALVSTWITAVLFAARPSSVVTTSSSDRYVGATPDQVLEAYGGPHRVSASATSLTFEYDDKDGESARFVFHDGMAVVVPAAGFEAKTRIAPEKGQLFVGQSLRAAVALVGAAKSATFSATSLELDFGGKRVLVAHGRIVAVR